MPLRQYTRERSTKALAAVTALHQLHCVWRHGPRPWSLLLDQAMESAGAADTQVAVHYLHLLSPTLTSCLCQLGEAGIRIPGPESSQQQPAQADLATIKESLVTVHRDPQVSSLSSSSSSSSSL